VTNEGSFYKGADIKLVNRVKIFIGKLTPVVVDIGIGNSDEVGGMRQINKAVVVVFVMVPV
jgi:hypothetical protein